MRSNIWNIGKYGYIGIWILRIYRKNQTNIDGYFDKNMNQIKIIQNSLKYLENLKRKKMIKQVRIHILKLFYKCNLHKYD